MTLLTKSRKKRRRRKSERTAGDEREYNKRPNIIGRNCWGSLCGNGRHTTKNPESIGAGDIVYSKATGETLLVDAYYMESNTVYVTTASGEKQVYKMNSLTKDRPAVTLQSMTRPKEGGR